MNLTSKHFFRLAMVAVGLTLPAMLDAAPGDDGPPKKSPPSKSDDDRRHGPEGDRDDPFRNLTPEQRDQLREAVRKAWSDPVVLEARDKLKSAAEDYQNALNAAIKRSSPELTETIDSLRRDSESAFRIYGPSPGKGGGEPGGPGGPGTGGRRDWRNYEGFLTMENPPYLRDLSPEQQTMYREAHTKAMQADGVKSRLSSLRDLRKTDDEMRKQRIEQIRRVHAAIRRAMIEADPRLEKVLPERSMPGGEKGPDGPGPGPSPKPPRPESDAPAEQ